MHKPQVQHMEAVFRILRYLKGNPGRGILYQENGHLNLRAYTDADWAGDRDDRKSTSGYFTLVGGNLVTWRSKNRKWWHYLVQRLSSEVWQKEFKKYFGSGSFLLIWAFLQREAVNYIVIIELRLTFQKIQYSTTGRNM